MRGLVFLVAMMASTVALANTSVFGMALEKTTESQFKERFDDAELMGKWPNTQGNAYQIDGSGIDFNGVKLARVVFDKNGQLVAVMTMIDGKRFDGIKRTLNGKYTLIRERDQGSVMKTATFVAGDQAVIDIAYHPSKSDMVMNYHTSEFYQAMMRTLKMKRKAQNRREADQL